MITKDKHRSVKSFVKREGRMSVRQTNAISNWWERYGVDFKAEKIDFSQIFNQDAATILEIGFGMGRSLLQCAKNHPEQNYIGIEVHRPGVGALLADMVEQEVDNIRIFQHDAIEVLSHCIPPQSLNKIMIFFPDPWPKKRHHKRRIIQPEFVKLANSRLKPGGTLHLATDWEHYAQHMMMVLSSDECLLNSAGAGLFIDGSNLRPRTKFESRGERLGHQIWDLLFKKV